MPQPSATATGTDRLRFILLYAGVIAYMTLFSGLLTVLHIPYDTTTGNFIFKIHPGTYLILIAFMLSLLRYGNPLQGLSALCHQHRAMSFYVASIMALLIYAGVRYGTSGLAFLVDSLLMAGILTLVILELSEAEQLSLFRLITFIIVLNSVIALGETLLHKRLVPYTFSGQSIIEDTFRAMGVFGHPLMAAFITGLFLICTLQGKRQPVLLVTIIGTLCLGLLAFGGRTSFILTYLIIALYYGSNFLHNLIKGRYSYLQICGAILGVYFLLFLIAVAIFGLGLGERIFTHMKWDNSANTRLYIWNMLTYLHEDEFLFGVSPVDIRDIIRRMGLIEPLTTIENFWLLMYVEFGLLWFLLFFSAFITAMYHFWSSRFFCLKIGVIYFLITASSSNSFAGKSQLAPILFTIMTLAPTWMAHSQRAGKSTA